MPRYLDPKADIVFKKIFGEHPELLKSFLNAVLPLPDDRQIVELNYLPSEQIPHIPVMKRTIAGVRCKDVNGRSFIVEMQIEWTDSFKQRLLFEAGQAFVKQLQAGEDYKLLEPVYGLGIIATNFDPDPNHWYHHYQLVNVEKPVREVIEHLQLVFIELKKFPIKSALEKRLRLLWLRFLREVNEKSLEASAELLAVPEISQALALAEQSAYSEGELRAYEEYWDAVSTEKTLLNDREAKGRAEGRAEGLAEGEAKGKAEGLVVGKLTATLEIAKQLQREGMSVDFIAKVIGLSEQELRDLLHK